MAAPSFNNHDYQFDNGTSGLTLTLGAPGNFSLSAGDLLVAYVCAANSSSVWSAPTGWNLFDDKSYYDSQACFWKVASANDTNRISGYEFRIVGGARRVGVIFNVSGANTVNPFDGNDYLAQGGNSNQPSSNAFSNTTSYIGDFLYIAQFGIEGKNASGFTAPSGYTAVGSNPGIETTGGGGPSTHLGCGIAYKQVTNTNLNPAAVFTATGSDGWTATMLRINPQPPPTAPTSRTLSAADTASAGGEVDLSWNQDTAAWPAPTYTIEKSTDGTNFTTHATGVTNQTSYTVTGLTNNQLYYFRITGTNASGSAVSNTASATPTAFSRENTLEGGTDEDAISTNASSSGPDAFDLFYSNTAAVYDTARAKGGTVSMRTEHSGTTGSSMAGWTFTSNTQGINPSKLYTRFYFYATSAPSADVTIVRYGDSSDSANAYIDFLSTGVFRLTVSGSGSVTLSTATSLNTWVRVETRFGSGTSTIRLFNTTESTTPTEQVNDGGLQSAIGTVRFGVNNTTAGGPFWWDSLALSANNYIGPESTGSTSFQGKLGDLTVSKMYLGDTEVTGGYLGDIDLWA
jgi:hypothetical protein